MFTPENQSVQIENHGRGWQYAINGVWDNRIHATPEAAEAAAFAELRDRGYTEEQARRFKWRSVTPLD